eukprot:jgi/Undpi1/12800/HiC_scaffold_7.g02467.m1
MPLFRHAIQGGKSTSTGREKMKIGTLPGGPHPTLNHSLATSAKDNESAKQEVSYDVDLACSGSASCPLVEDSGCDGPWGHLWSMAWLTKYIHLFTRLLNTLAVFTICLLVCAVSAGASAIARGKKPRSVQRRKLLAKRQRLRLMAIRSVTEMGTRHWNALSDQISWLSETIWHLRNQQCHRGKSRRLKRQASAHFLSRQHRAASSASGNFFTNILAFSSSLARRSSPRRWVLLSFYN